MLCKTGGMLTTWRKQKLMEVVEGHKMIPTPMFNRSERAIQRKQEKTKQQN